MFVTEVQFLHIKFRLREEESPLPFARLSAVVDGRQGRKKSNLNFLLPKEGQGDTEKSDQRSRRKVEED